MKQAILEPLQPLGVPIAGLAPYPGNPRRGDVAAIRASLQANGQFRPLVVNRPTMQVLAGNHTLLAARELGWGEIAVTYVDVDAEAAARIVLADNRTNDLAGYDDAALAALLGSLPSFDGTGYEPDDLAGLLAQLEGAGAGAAAGPTLAERFGVPPFSVLDARQGYWLERKRAWLDLGIRSEVGRGDDAHPGAALRARDTMVDASVARVAKNRGLLLNSASGRDPQFYPMKTAAEARLGRELSTAEFQADHYDGGDGDGGVSSSGTSVFDPVLCELAYRWFCPPGGRVLDPFAGGSVRGILAAKLGRRYVGVDLRPEQVAANEAQADELLGPADPRPAWVVGDARDLAALLPDSEPFDFAFSCPPYFDLERYSDDSRDLSNAEDYAAFAAAYAAIVAATVARLHDNRFACFVVGDVRGRDGGYVGLVPDTIRVFEQAGARLYNEAILVTSVGSLPIRVARSFVAGRKLGKTHQNVLVFLKGSPADATEACGAVEVAVPEPEPDEP